MTEFFQAAVRMGTPLLLMALGGTWTLQTGILNIGQEGGLILASFFAVLGNHLFGSWVIGIVFAVAVALVYNMIFAFFSVTLRSNIWVIGMALNIMGSALSILFLKSFFGVKGSFRSPNMVRIPDVELSFLPSWLDGFSLIVWVAVAVLAVVAYMDSRTVLGMRLKAAGENEEALDAAGVPVWRLRYGVLVVNSLMVGLAGAFLSTSYLLSFVRGMSADRGWMAVAAVIFGDGHLGWTFFAVIIFGVAQAGGFQLQAMGVPSHLALMLPYVLVIVALVTRGIGKGRSS
ncbi:ABC transporter permease [Dethiosulfovibrio sp. F2B]|uniref:ABC transporter permease n=1 Tax=Dethiosulfovibrio faecalis TaxID=2720018 RepID=UPI001F481AF7|nr:ABC transporter permease [Dethiosulfovibrio faecalis]MCF4152290.1 ABC transporter permease [Dethiosulfovibrio faecalis]